MAESSLSSSDISSKSSFGKAAANLGKSVAVGGLVAGGIAVAGSAAYTADQELNGGRTTEAVKSGLSATFNAAKIAGGAISDVAASAAGNPWMQGLAAVGAAVLSWKMAPWLLEKAIPGDGMLSGLGRGAIGLAFVGAMAYSAAVAVGALHDDPQGPQTDGSAVPHIPVSSAADDARLQQPAAPMQNLSFGSGGM